MTTQLLHLENRAVLRLTGSENRSLLQGLVTNDVMAVTEDKAVYAALLTPQGKFMFDMIIVADAEDLLLDIEAERKPQLMQRLMMYKLRADVEIIDEAGLKVWALWDGDAEAGVAYKDPRHKTLKQRVIAAEVPHGSAEPLTLERYEERRVRHGIPDGSRDMMLEKYFWLETNAEKLNGVSFTKGCFVGQELTARMKHRTTLKKMLQPVKLDGPAEEGAEITTAAGKNAGTLHSTVPGYGIAYLRLEHAEAELLIGDTKVTLNTGSHQ